jgi:hypothetical protein
MTKKTTEKIIVLALSKKEYNVILSALMVLESGFGMWEKYRDQKKFVVDLLNKIAP